MNRSPDGVATPSPGKDIVVEVSAEVEDFSVMVDLITPPPISPKTQRGAEAQVSAQPASSPMHDTESSVSSALGIASLPKHAPDETATETQIGRPAAPDVLQVEAAEMPSNKRGEHVIESPATRQETKEKPARELAMTPQTTPVKTSAPVVSKDATPTISREKNEIVRVTPDAHNTGTDGAMSSKLSPETQKEVTETSTSREHTKATASTDTAKKEVSAELSGPSPKPVPTMTFTEVSSKTVGETPDLQVLEPQVPRAQTSAEGAAPSKPAGLASPPAPQTVPSIPGQIAATLSVSETGMAEIVLDPEELGKVRLTLTQTEGRTILIVEAQRPETIDLMRRNLDELTAEFADAGYAGLSFDFRDNPQNWDDPDPGTTAVFAADEFEGSGAPNDNLTALNVTDRLDLRL